MKLYELADEYRAAALALDDLDLPDDVIADTLESMAGDLTTKAANIAMIRQEKAVAAAAIMEASKEMAKRSKAAERIVERLDSYLLSCMMSAGIDKIESPYIALSIRANPAKVEIFSTDELPADYWRQAAPPPLCPDKTLIGKALKDGHDVPGAKLVKSVRLEIK